MRVDMSYIDNLRTPRMGALNPSLAGVQCYVKGGFITSSAQHMDASSRSLVKLDVTDKLIATVKIT